MSALQSPRARLIAAAATLILVGAAAGFGLSKLVAPPPSHTSASAAEGRKVLYWYDPMSPGQRFDKPGKSPYMDMDLVPKYADEAQGDTGLAIDPARVQSLGLRTAVVRRGALVSGIEAPASVEFNQRDVAIVQARAGGFVQRAYGHAPDDIVPAGAALADILVPDWAGAQGEFLAVRRTGDAALIAAARQRLRLLGMPEGLIAQVERTGRTRNVVTVTTPTGGAIRVLQVRPGMTVAAGQTLAEINGLGTVWVNAAAPEALGAQVKVGQAAQIRFAALPGQTFSGSVRAILPQAQGETRTLTLRIELANPGGRLRPGMFATVQLGGGDRPALLVPSEAVIRTGRRAVVILALEAGRYRPAEVQIGQEAGGQTEILAGLSEGETVVASGQFLIDSEASLASVKARPIGGQGQPAPVLHQASGRIEAIDAAGVTLSHGPVPALGWPAMTMTFRLADPALASGFAPGDRVRFDFDQPPAGPTVRRLQKDPGR